MIGIVVRLNVTEGVRQGILIIKCTVYHVLSAPWFGNQVMKNTATISKQIIIAKNIFFLDNF